MMKENVIEASGTAAASWRVTSEDDVLMLRYGMKSAGGGYIGGPEDAEEHLRTPLHANPKPYNPNPTMNINE